MLSDAPFLSPWSSEVLIKGDYKLPAAQQSDEEDEFDLYNFRKRLCVDSLQLNVAGSECSSEDLYGDDDSLLNDIELSTAYCTLETNLNDVIDATAIVNASWCDEECHSPANTSSINSNTNNNSKGSSTSIAISSELSTSSTALCTSPTFPTLPEASQAFTCSTLSPASKSSRAKAGKNGLVKKWKNMSSSDRLKLIDELSLTISHQLDLREQMEIIKIIDPSANLNQQRMEFVIDLNVIDDVKLQKIQDIVNFHCVQSSDHLDNQSQASPSKKFSKRSKNQDRRPRIDKHRVQKEYRQKLKEKRSGLFAVEERMAVSSTSMEEEIDVLG
ncbi:protein FAM199X-like [Mya arenaria]|uniref:protein FAM199X-like n=1 Tax=Mya arenaria TaxID=6604 RepID=UPI0022E56EEE|nr:protein FAM199X-like [Mya arenaria]